MRLSSVLSIVILSIHSGLLQSAEPGTCAADDLSCQAVTDDAPSCKDDLPDCPELAAKGDCQNNPFKMLVNCKRSCKVCKVCTADKHPRCPEWAAKGECKGNEKWMMENCHNSCDCEPPCIDFNETCHFWEWHGEW